MFDQKRLAGPYLVAFIIAWIGPFALGALLAPFGVSIGLREYAGYWFGPGMALLILGLLVATVNFARFVWERLSFAFRMVMSRV